MCTCPCCAGGGRILLSGMSTFSLNSQHTYTVQSVLRTSTILSVLEPEPEPEPKCKEQRVGSREGRSATEPRIDRSRGPFPAPTLPQCCCCCFNEEKERAAKNALRSQQSVKIELFLVFLFLVFFLPSFSLSFSIFFFRCGRGESAPTRPLPSPQPR